MALSGALLLTGLGLAVLALIVIAVLPLLVLGALARTARPLARPRLASGPGRCRPTGFGLPGHSFVPSSRRMRPPLADDAGRSGGTVYDRRVVG